MVADRILPGFGARARGPGEPDKTASWERGQGCRVDGLGGRGWLLTELIRRPGRGPAPALLCVPSPATRRGRPWSWRSPGSAQLHLQAR